MSGCRVRRRLAPATALEHNLTRNVRAPSLLVLIQTPCSIRSTCTEMATLALGSSLHVTTMLGEGTCTCAVLNKVRFTQALPASERATNGAISILLGQGQALQAGLQWQGSLSSSA